ncbi:MAG TPA: EscU/YscU/HrcU family type III secretion system export apparatus switch protein [Rhizomicrobium sp.]|nr:EscU/YscU/HrcU family type III secretion system export apparatus switch protein [Rhizomicrobium sp.]
MAEDNTGQDKSEQPTQHKLQRSREKGVVARGMDLGFLTGLAAILGYGWIMGPTLAQAVSGAERNAFVTGPALTDSGAALLNASVLMVVPAVKPMLLLFAAVFLLVLLFEIVQTGAVFSTEPLKPDFNRLNPANGFKRIFSLRMLIETIKNIFKLIVYTTIAYVVLKGVLRTDIASIADARGVASVMKADALRLLAAFVLGAILFAAVDQVIARGQFLKKMRMDRRELRQEAKEREGEPRMKQKRKQLHREFAKASQSMRGLKGADVMIVNPQHIALALSYRPGESAAPLVVSMGVNQIAQRLKRLAFLYGVPIVENPTLARELYRKSVLGGPIPEHCYKPVADVYNAMRRRARDRDEQHAA